MQLWHALFLGGLQGVAELFPISSLAQTILIPALLKWNDVNRTGDDYLAFVVALHLATAVALVVYFWKEWRRVLLSYAGSVTHGRLVYDRDSKFAWLLVAGTVVVGVAGLAGEKYIRKLFDDPSRAWVVGGILAVNGLVMLAGDFVKRRAARAHPGTDPEHLSPADQHAAADRAMHAALIGGPVAPAAVGRGPKRAEDLTFPQATAVGAAQTLALVPGISRSGVTIIGGLWAGLTYEEATRFAFMLATPVIFAASILKVPKLLREGHQTVMLAVYGSLVAFVAAYLSTRFLMRYFHTGRLAPFGYFCIAFGGFAAVYLKVYAQ